MAQVTVKEALQKFADNPQREKDPIDTPVWVLISEQLFNIANSPNPKIRGSMAKSTRAQKMIFDRLTGKRRAGSRPATKEVKKIHFIDLTQVDEIDI